jgi:hypothetical protein
MDKQDILMDELAFTSHLLGTLSNNFAGLSDIRDTDLQTIANFAAMPELRQAREAAVRLRDAGRDMHPFPNSVISTVLEELGL